MPIDMKSIIADTFTRMVKQESIDKITVKALIEECHISRQTFYYHFQDIMDVLEWSIRKATDNLVERSLEAENMREVLRIFISFSVDQFPNIHRLMESQRRSQIERIMVDAVGVYLGRMIKHRRSDLSVNIADMEVLLRFNAYGLVGILFDYSAKPQLDQERLALQLEQILTGKLLRPESE